MVANEVIAMEADGMNETLRIYEGAADTLASMGEDAKVFPSYSPKWRSDEVPAIQGDVSGWMVGWAVSRAYFVNAFENIEDGIVSFDEILDAFDEVVDHIPTVSDDFGLGMICYK